MTEKQIQLFWQKVQVTDACWLWTASVGWNGYGMFGKPTRRTHRVALELAGVVLKPGEMGLHKCGQPRCVRVHPDHVYVGDQSQNQIDTWESGRIDREAFSQSVSLVTRGELNASAKLTENQVNEIRKRYEEGMVGRLRRSSVTFQMLADEFHVSYETIKRIIHRKSWRHL